MWNSLLSCWMTRRIDEVNNSIKLVLAIWKEYLQLAHQIGKLFECKLVNSMQTPSIVNVLIIYAMRTYLKNPEKNDR